MILISTLVKLAKQGATVYRVDFPEQKRQDDQYPIIDAHSEHFSTKARADRVAEIAQPLTEGEITVTPVAAASLNPLTTY